MASVSGRQRLTRAVALAVAASATPASADVAINLYGDVDGGVQTTGTRTGTADGFKAASLDLFSTSSAGRWSFLAEVLFEAGAENTFDLDVERIQIGYLVREWLRVFAGRFHTAIGYYNDAFHHGAYFLVPVGRPTMVEFEDGGGLIPAHAVGLHADGRFALGESHLRYDMELANGRSADPAGIQNHHDVNRPKALNLRLRYEPAGSLDGLIVGAGAYFDTIPARPAMTSDTGAPIAARGPLREWIIGAHAAYFEHDLHFVAEALAIEHGELDTGQAHWTYAAFGELGHAFDKVIPYVRYEWTQFPSEGDPYYAKAEADGYQAVSVGAKHATSDNVALKAQAGVAFSRAPGSDPLLTVTGQVAFAF